MDTLASLENLTNGNMPTLAFGISDTHQAWWGKLCGQDRQYICPSSTLYNAVGLSG